MTNPVNFIVLTIFAAIVIYFFMTQAYTIASPSVSLEAINFTANNTYFALANTPKVSGLTLYYFGNTTFPIADASVVANTTHVKIYTNGTDAYPNVTAPEAGTVYYASYDYQAPSTVFSINLGFMGALVAIGIVFGLLFKMIKRK